MSLPRNAEKRPSLAALREKAVRQRFNSNEDPVSSSSPLNDSAPNSKRSSIIVSPESLTPVDAISKQTIKQDSKII
jgi:hypothetical protein